MLLLTLAAATAPTIEVGKFDPAEFPDAILVERRMPHAELTTRVERLLRNRECSFDGQNKAVFDITVPYAVKLDPAGNATRVVVADIGCPQLERLVGEVAISQVDEGVLRRNRQNYERWYVSAINFSRGDDNTARKMDDPNKVVCRKQEPPIGSRIANKRICRTVAEWAVFEKDRDQLRRDVLDAGKGTNSR
jgi:hypothetical protein